MNIKFNIGIIFLLLINWNEVKYIIINKYYKKEWSV